MNIEKSFGDEIDKMMKNGEDPKAVLMEMSKAVSFYGRKINDAFPRIYVEDAPYILFALGTFRNALMKELDPSREEVLRRLLGD